MQDIQVFDYTLQLLPEKAIYIPEFKSLLVSDIHLGKSETFQSLGIPIPNQINQKNLDRLSSLCSQFEPENLFILGDLFHSKFALVDSVLQPWLQFVKSLNKTITLIIGNHDRALSNLELLSIQTEVDAIQLGNLLLSHEPTSAEGLFNICGHIHPCFRIKTRLDDLRLPCFFVDHAKQQLMLPSFGEFTGGYEVKMVRGAIAYVIAEDAIVPFKSQQGF